ncbi:putative 2,3-diketo-5-methylthio-1-phosphopentane phosphatase [Cryphonectria parasitica EP155]|uniref:2,3-diketo-5-methylthio-1-phosphopentane phosphatase n=1 Tax=Cryphonectria parasitica (strain ATCC 38755 / EP155) TaxID=660469 RepID=A0A9P5CKM9_CRYP1|nr:putative 2,3-diketo-5-methylthio-1-phosphopentane phosphatase [Cryphonectria parasitica EP155]KAF3760940.1 putative 2,3-diketo-5-methylthio-1-phosphopentane phosphatase [Cryphonectria parasitica EP155]
MPAATIPAPIAVKEPANLAGVLNKKRKIICFSDFDGTIFMQDTGHVLFDRFGCGSKRRDILDEQIKTGERSFREVSEEMWGSLNVPFDDGFEVMEESLDIDPDFRSFHKFCLDNEIPFNVISAGLKPVLRKVLDTFLGEEQSKHIDIVANDADINQDGSEWKVLWRHDTELGHDKALSIQEARAAAEADLAGDDGTIPLIVFIGDGVSDLPAARQADVLFARRGLRLEEYCVENDISYIPFDTFAGIQTELESIMAEDAQKTGGMGVPARFNPRANLWRRVSSKSAVPRYVVMTPAREDKMFLWPEAFSELKTPGVETKTLELGSVTEDAVAEATAPAVVVPAA